MASIDIGAFVQWCGGRGRVDLLVTKGSVPDITGPRPPLPAARVHLWASAGDRWAPTGRRVAVPTADLRVIPPPLPPADGADRLVALLTAHHEYVQAAGLGEAARPTGAAVKQVYLRGLTAWPGETKTSLRPQEWALERVHTFLTVAAGGELDGYRRDLDLLPEEHVASTRQRSPRLTAPST